MLFRSCFHLPTGFPAHHRCHESRSNPESRCECHSHHARPHHHSSSPNPTSISDRINLLKVAGGSIHLYYYPPARAFLNLQRPRRYAHHKLPTSNPSRTPPPFGLGHLYICTHVESRTNPEPRCIRHFGIRQSLTLSFLSFLSLSHFPFSPFVRYKSNPIRTPFSRDSVLL